MGQRVRRFHNIHFTAASRLIVLQTLLTALKGNLTGFQILLREIRRQHVVLACQRGHGVDMLDDKLTVGDPQLHIFQIARVKARFLHGLVERVVERVVRLVYAHTLIGKLRRLRVGAQDKTNGFLVGFQCRLSVLSKLTALPLRPQPDHPAKGNQTADDGVDKARDDKLLAVQRQNLQGINRGNRKADGGPTVVATDDQVAPQRDDKHSR